VRSRFQDYIPDYTFLVSISGLIILIDQLTKWIVRSTIPFGQSWMPLEWLMPYFHLVNWHNSGAAFGLFQKGGNFIAVLAFVVAVAIVIYYPIIPRSDKFLRLALAMQLAGALGNLIDRLLKGAVTDFISVGNFPVFNVADSSISVGVALLLIPYLPQLPAEWSIYRTMKQARQINTHGRVASPHTNRKTTIEEDAVTLGILEVIFQDTSPLREFILSQRAKRIRYHYLHHRQASPGRERQTQKRRAS
jgi:signal peptidase II